MTSYKSLSGELADLMRQAALDDTDMRPAARVRRATAGDTSIRSAIGEMKNVQYGSMYHQTMAGIPVPPTFQRPSSQMYDITHRDFTNDDRDLHGFPLPQGTSHELYQAMMAKIDQGLGKRREKWAELHQGSGTFTHGPGRSRPKRAIRLGIPSELRLQAWIYYSSASQLKVGHGREYFGDLVGSKVPSRMFDLEIGQTFVTNLKFGTLSVASGTEPGRMVQARTALSKVLLAYAHHFSLESIPGSLNVIASAVLLATEDEEHTFWLLVAHSARAGPSFSSVRGRNCAAEQDILLSLLDEKYPKLAKHFRASGIDSLQPLTGPWTSSLFIEHLPFDTVLRVLDAYFHEGPKILLRVSLALFHINRSKLLLIRDPFELRRAIEEMPLRMLDQQHLMSTAFNDIGSMSTEKINRLRRKALEKWDTSGRPSNYGDGSLPIAFEEEDHMFAFSMGNPAPIPLPAVPMMRVNVSTESSDALLSMSPPRFRKQQINSALLSSLAEEQDITE